MKTESTVSLSSYKVTLVSDKVSRIYTGSISGSISEKLQSKTHEYPLSRLLPASNWPFRWELSN